MHFTYSDPDRKVLKQGDILKKTPELLALIQEVHPHYAGEDYLYFQVLTQSCDLVIRKGKCKTRYITLAAVRSLDLIVKRHLEDLDRKKEIDNQVFCSTEYKIKIEDFFKKLLNNNDTNNFYLEAEPTYGIDRNCCTQLHLSISIRAYEHYDVCLNAKILELHESFRAKLGWLVGNLYSRVGTEDYMPGKKWDLPTYEESLDKLMRRYIVWVNQDEYSLFSKKTQKNVDLNRLPEIIASEKQRARDSKLNGFVSDISKTLDLDEAKKKQLRNVISQHPLLQKIL